MKEKNIKKMELNTKMLENFEEIMATKLDEVEELKVTGLDQGSKLVNIISLCANVKTLILESDPRLDVDKIMVNLFQPENLENLIFNNSKIPTAQTLKKYTNLKIIILNDIRFCHLDDFLGGIVHPEKVETIRILNTDIQNCSLETLERFPNLNLLTLNNVKNVKQTNLEFLKKKTNLAKLEMINNPILLTELNDVMDCPCEKQIKAQIVNATGKIMKNCRFKIEKNTFAITIPIKHLRELMQYVSLQKMDQIKVIVNTKNNKDFQALLALKSYKAKITILVQDFSCLTVRQTEQLKDTFALKNLQMIGEKGKTKIPLEKYRKIREQIEEILKKIPNKASDVENFLQIYQSLGKEFEIVQENPNIQEKTCTVFQICQLLQNCLKCVRINSNIVFGEELENDKKHYWNQVELEEKWYNVDLSLDQENLLKNKAEYCLLGDKDFLETHTPKGGKNNYCAENFNSKLIHVFLKTGLLKEKLLTSYLKVMATKIRKLFLFPQEQKVLALSEAKKEKKR